MKDRIEDEDTSPTCFVCEEPLITEDEYLTGFCSDHAFGAATNGDPHPLNFRDKHHSLADEMPEVEEDAYAPRDYADDEENLD